MYASIYTELYLSISDRYVKCWIPVFQGIENIYNSNSPTATSSCNSL